MAAIRSASAPYSADPMRASPESFSRIRLNAGRPPSPEACTATLRLCLLADLEACEAADHHVLARLRGGRRPELLDRLPAVLVLVHVLLVQEDDLLEPFAELALRDLWAHVLGLVGGLLLVDPELGLLGVLWHVLL